MLRAVPSTIRMADSRLVALRSAIFVSAIERTFALESVPTLFLFGVGEPFSIPSSLRMRSAAGGLFVTNVYERSSKIVTTAGTTVPVSGAVFSLYSLMNWPMLMPCGPSAVPTGGAAVALPAWIWTFTTALIFFICSTQGLRPCHPIFRQLLHQLFDLEEVELDRRLTAEDRHEDLHLVALGVHLVHDAVEIGERPVGDPDGLALGERDLVLRGVELDLAEDRLDLLVGERRRRGAHADEARDAGRVAHDVPGVVPHLHLDEDVPGIDLALHRVALAVLDLDLLLGGHEDLEDLVAHVHRVDAVLEVRLHLVLVTRVGVDDVPAPVVLLLGGLARRGRGPARPRLRLGPPRRPPPRPRRPPRPAGPGPPLLRPRAL